jgi:hypothetical protein
VIQVVRRRHAETQKHPVPVLMSIGDELTNKGLEGVAIAERLARFVWLGDREKLTDPA